MLINKGDNNNNSSNKKKNNDRSNENLIKIIIKSPYYLFINFIH